MYYIIIFDHDVTMIQAIDRPSRYGIDGRIYETYREAFDAFTALRIATLG